MATQGTEKTPRLTRQFKAIQTGELTPRVHENVASIVFTTPANGKSEEVPLSSFPEGIQKAAMAYGLNATIGNAMGNLDDKQLEDPDEIMKALRERIKSLQAGKWAGERTSGGRPSLVWEGFQAFRKSKGLNDNEAKLAALHTQWFEDAENFKKLMKSYPAFTVFLAQFKAERKPADAAPVSDLMA